MPGSESPPQPSTPAAAAIVEPTDPAVDDSPQMAEVPARTSYAKAAAHGFSWMTAAMVAGRGMGFLAQIALGNLLSEDDFGVYAIVISVAAMLRVFHDGGVPQVLIQRGSAEVDRLLSTGFWLTLLFGAGAGLLLAAASPLLAWLYGEPRLTPLLLVIALAFPLAAPSSALKTKLRVDLRFQTLAQILLVWFAVRHFGSVGLALLGMGAMSMVLPLLGNALFEWLQAYWVTRLTPWFGRPNFAEWPSLLRNTIWVVINASCRMLTRAGDYLVLGAMLDAKLLGIYFFSYLMASQFIEVLAMNLNQVMFPVMSRVASQPERQSRALLRTLRLLVLVAAPMSLVLAATIRPLELLLWNGKWAAGVPLMQIFAATAPLRMFSDAMTAAVSGRGQFRTSALLTLIEGLWLMLSAWAAATYWGVEPTDLTEIAATVAVSQMVFSIGSSLLLLRTFGIGAAAFLGAILPAWLASAAAALAAVGVINLLSAYGPAATFVAGVVTFGIAFWVIARAFLKKDLDSLIQVLPARASHLVRRAFLLG